jgi:hypothetical protein
MTQLVQQLNDRASAFLKLADAAQSAAAAHRAAAEVPALTKLDERCADLPAIDLGHLAYDLDAVLGPKEGPAKVVLARLPDGTLAALKMSAAQQALEAFSSGRVRSCCSVFTVLGWPGRACRPAGPRTDADGTISFSALLCRPRWSS